MKKSIITILALCLVQLSFTQSIKSIRVNNSIQGKSWSYAISEIDSITYDSFRQLQKLYANGVCEEAILESVDSISFSSDEPINVVLSRDYIDDVKSYIFSNGIVLTEKEDSLQGKIIMLDSLDVVQNQWSDEKSFMIYCDSTYKPFFAKNSQNIFYFGYDENRNLIEINATDLDGNIISPMKANARKNAILRVSTEGWTTGDDIGAALDLYGTVNTMYNPNRGNIAGTVTSWLAKLLPQGIPQDLVGLTPSLIEALNGGKAGLLGAILGYIKLIQHIGENRARSLIGDCTPYIKSACKEGNNSAVINVQIAGVSSNTQCTPYYQIRYWQEVDGERTNVTYTTTPVKATNGTHPITIGNLHGGRYGFQVLIFPDLFLGYDNLIGLYNFRSNIAYVDIAPLHFKVLEQDYTTYADDCVTVSMKAVIDFPSEQDETILSYYDSYGVYVHYNNNVNQREDYYSVKENGSNEFYITLDIPRDEFSCNYSSFIATCSNKITFKTYTIEGWGIKEFYDEQEMELIYDEYPEVHTGEASSVSQTQATVKCEFKDCLFWNVLRGVEYFTGSESESILLDANKEDGEYDFHLDGLAPNTTYNYRAYYEVDGVREYGDMKYFKTEELELCPDHNHPHLIDLGLPSGTKWACCNVGASVPEGYGGYYAWGETKEKSSYTQDTYKYYIDIDGDGYKDIYQNIGSNISGTSYDVAHMKWGGGWRMPTRDEIKELLNKCFWEWTSVNGINGRRVTGPNGNSIFLPAVGECSARGLNYRDSYGVYWFDTLCEGNSSCAYFLIFSSSTLGSGSCSRSLGHAVRPVTE